MADNSGDARQRLTFHFTRDGQETAATYTIQPLDDRLFLELVAIRAAISDDELQRGRTGKPVEQRSKDFARRVRNAAFQHGLVGLRDEHGRAVPPEKLRTMGVDFEAQVFIQIWTSNIERLARKGGSHG